jgi:acetyl esterase
MVTPSNTDEDAMTLDRAASELLAQVRVVGVELLDQMKAWNGPAPDMAATTDHAIAGVFAPVRVLVPTRRPRAVLIWYHGRSQGYAATDVCPAIGRELAGRTGRAVVLAGCASI